MTRRTTATVAPGPGRRHRVRRRARSARPACRTGEAVFTTGMTGYQEVLTDPSYCGQIVTMTAPQMGNVGVNRGRHRDTTSPRVAGFIVHELSSVVEQLARGETLDAYLKRQRDRRHRRRRHARAHAAPARSRRAEWPRSAPRAPEQLLARAKAAPSMSGLDLDARRHLRAHATRGREGAGVWNPGAAAQPKWHVVADRLRHQAQHPALPGRRRLQGHGGAGDHARRATSWRMDPDGVFLSNGPGDPAAVKHGIETVGALLGKKPLFGICLGHQLSSLALGGKTYKLKFGHRGAQPAGQGFATGAHRDHHAEPRLLRRSSSRSQGRCELTHLHLNDQTSEGIAPRQPRARSACSTTPKPAPDRTTRSTCSSASPRR